MISLFNLLCQFKDTRVTISHEIVSLWDRNRNSSALSVLSKLIRTAWKLYYFFPKALFSENWWNAWCDAGDWGVPPSADLHFSKQIHSLEQMATATVTGKDGKKQLDLQITCAIKSEVLCVFGSSLSSEGQTKLWNGCIASIAGKCKNLRYAKKKASEIAGTLNL